jgi:hypothetical protein
MGGVNYGGSLTWSTFCFVFAFSALRMTEGVREDTDTGQQQGAR